MQLMCAHNSKNHFVKKLKNFQIIQLRDYMFDHYTTCQLRPGAAANHVLANKHAIIEF